MIISSYRVIETKVSAFKMKYFTALLFVILAVVAVSVSGAHHGGHREAVVVVEEILDCVQILLETLFKVVTKCHLG